MAAKLPDASLFTTALITFKFVGAIPPIVETTDAAVVPVTSPANDAENVGVCHVAKVPLVAVRTCPAVGAVAADTLTSVVADFNKEAVTTFVAPVNVLFVNVCIAANVANVPAPEGITTIPPLFIEAIVGVVNVLFVKVSVVVLPTKVSVIFGNVNVPVFVMALKDGADENVFTPANV